MRTWRDTWAMTMVTEPAPLHLMCTTCLFSFPSHYLTTSISSLLSSSCMSRGVVDVMLPLEKVDEMYKWRGSMQFRSRVEAREDR
jgi:hypothetical protein